MPTSGKPSEGTLRQLHLHYVAGRFELAAALGQSMLGLSGTSRWRERIHYYTAMAFFQLAQPEHGAGLLDEAWKYAREVGDPQMLVECMAADAAVAYYKQAANGAEVAKDALIACRKLTPVPRQLEARLLSLMSTAYLLEGDWELALSSCKEGMKLVPSSDVSRQAKLFDAAALAYEGLGQLDIALDYARRAVELHTLVRHRVSVARSENNLGWMFIESGQHDEARAHLERSLRIWEEIGVEIGRCNVLLSLGELSLAEGDPKRARELAAQGLEFADRFGEEATSAEAHALLGRIAEALSEPDVADAEFRTAIEQYGRRGSRGRLALCHRQYAAILERRGEVRLARRHAQLAMSYEPAPPSMAGATSGDSV